MLLGYGYETFWSPKRIETFSRTQGWSVPNAHCAYLDTLLNIGLVGLGLSLSMIFLSVKASWRQYMVHRDYGCGFVCILIMARSFNAILESALAVPTSFPAFTMIVGLAYLAFRILPKTKPAARDMIAEEQMVGVAP
jgi:O-antigen ligase